ncbi:unnamed protein product [Leptosia nina]|uniref:CRAL-TRIO domain-containing protein n=1 Tax=Leptosia nina TaxID=320188 RepID=A0AAV1IYI8_9NEOP
MEKLPPSTLLKFNPNQMNEVRKAFNLDDLKKLEQALDHFEDWIKMQNHFAVKEFDRDYLERFLIANKGSVEIAKKRLDKLCTLRTMMPDFLRNFDVTNELPRMIKWMHACVLPQPTKDNYRVLATMVHDPEAVDYIDFIGYYRFYISIVEYLFKYDYNAGYEVIFDTRQFSLSVVSKLSPIAVKNCTTIFLEALAFRLKRLHIISGSKLFDFVMSIIKQALTEKLVKRIVIHDDPSTLQQYIPKEMLPVDFGGTETSMKELCEANVNEFCTEEHIARLKKMEAAVSDESKRLSYKFNEEHLGLPGSFKTLCVD